MAEEFSRTTARKRITLPHGGQVDIPIITKISFIDPTMRFQEYQYTIENSAQGKRTVHVDEVPSSANPEGEKLPVERIDKWSTIDATRRAQETEIAMDNVTGGDTIPPRFTTHQKTHVKRYTSETDANVWIESELIDEFWVEDPVSRHQETRVTLNHTDQPANSGDPDISDSGNGIDPPWRTDPFQNIVDWNDHEPTTGEATVDIGWITGAITWHDASTGSPPNVLKYVGDARTRIETGLDSSNNPATSGWGFFIYGMSFVPIQSELQFGDPGNGSETQPVPISPLPVSFDGFNVTLGTVPFTNGDSFTGVSYDFSGVTAEYIPPPTGEVPPGYFFPFPGSVRHIHFQPEYMFQSGLPGQLLFYIHMIEITS